TQTYLITVNGGAGDDRITGGAMADTLNGGGGADVLTGGAGNDIINGGLGADVMRGGAGDDVFTVDNSGDNVVEGSGGGNDSIFASVTYTLLGRQVETLTLTGTANISALGNDSANTLVGNSGNNVLRGGLGKDVLTGGAGRDIFGFDTALGSTNIDRITDFTVVDDTIRLSRSVFSAITANGALSASAFQFGSVALDADDRILYNRATGGLFYDADGVGGVDAVLFARLEANLALTNADFLIVA
ncbi:MAG: calcium-binding protein, partial [Sphingobium sp.]